mmetsp:Transcript_9510/g.24031  ORF Transcript_9510/g.24031 Transcript_9510/m.24031 type:complete len:253 (-) Transcript_9510:216-974(-)
MPIVAMASCTGSSTSRSSLPCRYAAATQPAVEAPCNVEMRTDAEFVASHCNLPNETIQPIKEESPPCNRTCTSAAASVNARLPRSADPADHSFSLRSAGRSAFLGLGRRGMSLSQRRRSAGMLPAAHAQYCSRSECANGRRSNGSRADAMPKEAEAADMTGPTKAPGKAQHAEVVAHTTSEEPTTPTAKKAAVRLSSVVMLGTTSASSTASARMRSVTTRLIEKRSHTQPLTRLPVTAPMPRPKKICRSSTA